ncbi:MAG: ABC transporter permease [Burkholderiales bacterium]
MSSKPSPGLWTLAWRRLQHDRVGMVALVVVGCYLFVVFLALMGWVATDWNREVGVNYAPPVFLAADQDETAQPSVLDKAPAGPVPLYGLQDPLAAELVLIQAASTGTDDLAETPRRLSLLLGGDKWGHDVLTKVIKGSETSILVGLVSAFLATLLGTVMGAVAGYFGRWVDDLFNWLYGVFTAIPYLLLVFAIAAVLQQKGVVTLVLILGLTGWTGVFRLVRAEYLKHKAREYVLAAGAMGASHVRRMFVHILPNTSHVILVQLSQNVVGFIKSEVILSFLGFGVPVDVVSWGSMLNEAQNELILGKWWQLAAAGVAMAILVTAFSMLTDALRDALDPKLKY